jgi:glutathione S-transferase
MKLYTWGPAPNPRRVRIFLAEKSLQLDLVDVGAGAVLAPEFLATHSHRMVPALELDDGTVIGEAAAICRYLEALHPEPALFGRDARQAALIDMWERKCEFECLQAAAEVFRNVLPVFGDRGLGGYDVAIPQIPALIERGTVRVREFCKKLDSELGKRRFVAGDDISMADITGLCALDFAKRARLSIPEECAHVSRWHAELSARPSAKP